MKQKMRMLIGVLCLCLLLPMTMASAKEMPKTLYERKTAEPISSGATHEHIQRFTSDGWWNIHVLRVDLNNPNQEIVAMKGPNGLSQRATVNAMVDATPSAIAGVNGDYFEPRPAPSSLGVMVSQGEMISSPPHLQYALPAFYLDANKDGHVGYLDRDIKVTNQRTGVVVPINMVNKISSDYTTLAYLDQNWGKTSPGNSTGRTDVREVVVVGNKVTEVRDNKPGVAIPEEGYVLAVKKEKFADVQVGDQMVVSKSLVTNATQVPFAMGGGSIIVQNGEVTLTNIHSAGNHPRTGIGVTQDQSQLLLVTIDGRHSSFKGIDQKLFGQLMKELGAYQAVNLDGGGSTTMAISPRNGNPSQVVNRPSDGAARQVVNGVGIVSKDPVGPLSYLKVSAADDGVHQGLSLPLTIVGYDAAHHVVPVDPTSLSFSLEGLEGNVSQSVFYPGAQGRGKIHVSSGEAKGSFDVEVYGPIVALRGELNAIQVGVGETKAMPTWYGVDGKGRETALPAGSVQYEISGNVGSMDGQKFVAGGAPASGYILVKSGSASKTLPVAVGREVKSVWNFESLEGVTSKSWPEGTSMNISLNDEKFEGQKAMLISYDFTQVEGAKAAYALLPQSEQTLLPRRPSEISIAVKADGKGAGLKATIIDANQVEHTVTFANTIKQTRWQTLPAQVPDGIAYPARISAIYLAQSDASKKDKGTTLVDQLTASYVTDLPKEGLPANTQVVDPLNGAGDLSAPVSLALTVEPYGMVKVRGDAGVVATWEALNARKQTVFLRGVTDAYKKGVTNQVYAANQGFRQDLIGNVKLISLSMKPGGIREAGADQWIALKEALAQVDQQVLVLALPYELSGMKDAMERDLLEELLENVAKSGKVVFVVQGGAKSGAFLKNGIRYLTLPGANIDSEAKAGTWAYAEIVVNGEGGVTYAINRLP